MYIVYLYHAWLQKNKWNSHMLNSDDFRFSACFSASVDFSSVFFFISWIAEVWPWLSRKDVFRSFSIPNKKLLLPQKLNSSWPFKGEASVFQSHHCSEANGSTDFFPQFHVKSNLPKQQSCFHWGSKNLTDRGPHFTPFILGFWAHLVGPKNRLIYHPCFFLAQFSNEEPSTWPPSCVDRIPMSHI